MRLAPVLLLISVTACSASSVADGGPSDGAVPVDGATHDAVVDAPPRVDGSTADLGVVCGTGAAMFPTFDRACGTDGDCTIGMHETSCCGSMDAMGIATSAQAAFAAAEASCEAMYPGCGCASNDTVTDDGTHTTEGIAGVEVRCAASVCTTNARAATPCGTTTCTSSQVCVMECSGIVRPDAGPLPSHCVDVPPACATSTSCSCFGATDPCPTGTCQSVSRGVPLCLCA